MNFYILNNTMKDILKRLTIWTFSILFLAYLSYLWFWNFVIVQTYFEQRNMLYYIVLALAFLYVFIFFSVSPFYFKFSKTTLFVLWISLIVLWDTILVNDMYNNIYLADIIKVFGVVFTLLVFTNFFITNKVKKEKEDSTIEIIEI